MAPAITALVELATTAGRALWGLFGKSAFQTGIFSGWLIFQDDEEQSAISGAVVGFGICLALIVAYLGYLGLVKLGVVKKKRK